MKHLPADTESPHADFLRAIQEWVWLRYPTRQLSASDIFYSLQWAESHIPASVFTQNFDAYLLEHPHYFDDGCKLSKLQFEAKRIIGEQQKELSGLPANTEIHVDSDPYDTAIRYITICGKRTTNPLLKDELRKIYTNLRSSRKKAMIKYPNWNKQTEEYYKFKAEAFLLWQDDIQNLCNNCLSMLSDTEQNQLRTLTPAEKIHCFQLGQEAETIYLNRILREKIARYFDFEELLNAI